jgi:hypothetical protein
MIDGRENISRSIGVKKAMLIDRCLFAGVVVSSPFGLDFRLD